jgi:hypothetical protein
MIKSGATIAGMAALIAGLSGCALGGPDVVALSDSYPSAGAVHPQDSWKSRLEVQTEKYMDYNLGDPDAGTVLRCTGYTVYDASGKKLRYVRNHIGPEGTGPEEITLPAGKYLILLEYPYERSPMFWVTLEKGCLTSVDVRNLPLAGK